MRISDRPHSFIIVNFLKIASPYVISAVLATTTTLFQPATVYVDFSADREVPLEQMYENASDEYYKTGTISSSTILEILKTNFASTTPEMIDVARCESSYRQYNPDGTLFKGWQNDKDWGVFQINTYYHGEKAKEMGLDLTLLKDNIEFAKYLYTTQGLKPWIWSKSCWSKSVS